MNREKKTPDWKKKKLFRILQKKSKLTNTEVICNNFNSIQWEKRDFCDKKNSWKFDIGKKSSLFDFFQWLESFCVSLNFVLSILSKLHFSQLIYWFERFWVLVLIYLIWMIRAASVSTSDPFKISYEIQTFVRKLKVFLRECPSKYVEIFHWMIESNSFRIKENIGGWGPNIHGNELRCPWTIPHKFNFLKLISFQIQIFRI